VIIAIANQKGGVGKTTLSVNLGAYFSHHSYKVALVDADPQGNATTWITPEHTFDNGLSAILLQHKPIARALRPIDGEWKLALLPGNADTADVLTFLAVANKDHRTIAQALAPLDRLADITLIDMPPSRAAGWREILLAADWILCPTLLERPSLLGVSLMARTCAEIAQLWGKAPRLLGIVPNQARNTLEHRQRLDELCAAFGPVVWPPIPQAIAVAEAAGHCQSLFSYAPSSPASLALETVARRVLQNAQGG